MNKITVNVLKKHIKAGRPESVSSCPIALALKAKGYKGVYVDEDYLKVSHKGEFVLPKRASNFVYRFDTGKPVKPFKFTAVRHE